MSHTIRAEKIVDVVAYRANVRTLQSRLSPARLLCVVKSNGYGHGLLPMAQAAIECGVTDIGVLDLQAGMSLRKAGIPDSIRVFAWLFSSRDDVDEAIAAQIDFGISSIAELGIVSSRSGGEPARIHLKIDTGLHRNGASEQQWPQLLLAANEAQAKGAVKIVGAWTHIAEASDAEDSAAIERFHQAIEVARGLGIQFDVCHLAASAAGFARADSRFDLVRMGAFTFGISPGGGVTASELGLVPVMTLRSYVESVQRIGSRTMATIPIGYGDGIPTDCAGLVSVQINSRRFIITAVDVDTLTVKASSPGAHSETEIQQGDLVTLFGTGLADEPTLQEWADAIGTIGEEIVVRLSPELPISYLG